MPSHFMLIVAKLHVCQPGRNHSPLRLVQMPTAKVQRYDVAKSVIPLVLLKAGLNAEVDTSLVSVTAIEDLAFVEHDRAKQPIVADALDEGAELFCLHDRENLAEFMRFVFLIEV